MKVIYIAETSLTNKSAYSHHVIKMCDAFSKLKHEVVLISSKNNLNFSYKKIQKDFALKGKKNSKYYLLQNFILKIFFQECCLV